MKKTVFALFAVLLVLLMVACDFFDSPGEEPLPVVTADGQQMVLLTITIGNGDTSRALTKLQAQAAVTDYEIAFMSTVGTTSATVYRAFTTAASGSTATATIYVPKDSYDYASEAVVLAGNSTKTLLAIGAISAVNGSTVTPGNPATIGSTTTSVTFTLTALTNDVNTNDGTSGTPSTFQILSPATHSTNDGTATIGTEGTYPVFSIPDKSSFTPYVPDPDGSRPLYNTSGTYITASYKVNCGTSNTLLTGVKLNGDWQAKSPTTAYSAYSTVPGLTGVVGQPMKPAPSATLTDGEFVFHINLDGASDDSGPCLIFISVPVVAIQTGNSPNGTTPVAWHIQGGIDNTIIDAGSASPGGGILLNVGNLQGLTATIPPIP